VKKEPTAPNGNIQKVTPVPDPDAGAGRKQIPVAPSLFDPNDRTANRSARPAWTYSTIAWPEKPKELHRPPTPPQATKQDAADDKEELDSSGWHAVQP